MLLFGSCLGVLKAFVTTISQTFKGRLNKNLEEDSDMHISTFASNKIDIQFKRE